MVPAALLGISRNLSRFLSQCTECLPECVPGEPPGLLQHGQPGHHLHQHVAIINFFRRSITDSHDSDESSISSSEISLGELCLVSLALAEREVKFVRTGITWEHHATMLIHEKQFDIKYRMPYASFEKLVRILEAKLYLDSSKSLSTCGHPAVAPPVILALTIRWLSGGSYHDVRDAGNISAPSFYRLLWLC